MPFISLTRLRIRSLRFLPLFAFHTLRSLAQIKRAPGFRSGSLLPDRRWTFWTLTAWDDKESMRNYMASGAHKAAMPKLMHWCNEASVAHWEQPTDQLPSWAQAETRMRETGRISKVRHPSPQHATLTFAPARLAGAGPIRPARSQRPHPRTR